MQLKLKTPNWYTALENCVLPAGSGPANPERGGPTR